MLVIGLDPGTQTTGYGLIKYESGRVFYVDSGNIVPDGGSFSGRIKSIYIEVAKLLDKYAPDVGVVEDIFYHKNVKSALKLAHLRGVIILSLEERGIPIFEFSPLEIKQSITGYGRAEKSQIKRMVLKLLRMKGENFSDDKLDNFDALASALCYINRFFSVSYGE